MSRQHESRALGALIQVTDELENVLALPIAAGLDAVGLDELVGFLAQNLADLVRCLDKELVLLALTAIVPGTQWSGIGVLLRIETSLWIEHFADDIVEDFLGDDAEELIADHRLTSERSQEPGV